MLLYQVVYYCQAISYIQQVIVNQCIFPLKTSGCWYEKLIKTRWQRGEEKQVNNEGTFQQKINVILFFNSVNTDINKRG